ncbi:MAG: hypothetical protein B6I20_14185 [Bacteroidetes bacterium 4572_117]|nr:MAG: hypothetical protein B6I20_14185 [Bacteroidetes bacterium 4572_117]
MKLSKFRFDVPKELIAKHPANERDESRLMVINRATGKIEHKMFKDILSYYGNRDVFVFNDTKVFPARLYGNKEKTGAKIEVFLLRELNTDQRLWDVLVDPARKIRIGAVAAPTAGMHFSKQLMKRLEIKGVEFAYITLHAGLGNFRGVEVEDLTKHKMDSEEIAITDETVEMVNKAKTHKRQICAVGTTVMRTLESSVSTQGELKPFVGWTNKFIFPPH